MEDHDDELERLIAARAASLAESRRDELQGELAEIDSQADRFLLTLQERQAAITEHRATIQRSRALIEAREASIREINKSSEILRRQNGVNTNRREEITRQLDPDTLINLCRRQVRAHYLSLLRSASLDPAAQATTSRAPAASSSNQVHQTSVDNPREGPEQTDDIHEEQLRRSRRNKTAPRYHEPGPSPPGDDAQGPDSDEHRRDGGRRKRVRQAGGESNPRFKKGKGKHSGTGSSSFVGPADARDLIEFDEVYAGGNAKTKYNIAEYPTGSNQWFIIRCLQHNKHFFRGALQGGAKHLNGKAHGLNRDYGLTVNMLGVRVLNCDAEKAKLNNNAVKKAADAGYDSPQVDIEHGETSATITVVGEGPRLPGSSRQSEVFTSVGDPIVGDIYQLLRAGEPAIAVVLPIGDLSCVGMTGNAITEIGIEIPSCYRLWKRDGCYRWNYHYRDGGDRVNCRRYPVMVFQEDMVIPPYPEPFSLSLEHEWYAFTTASKLRNIDLDDPVHQNVRGIEPAKAFRARIAALREIPNVQDASSREDTPRNGDEGEGANSGAAGDNTHGADKEDTVQANVADVGHMQREGEGSQARYHAAPSSPAAASEASGAPTMTTAELTDYLLSLHRDPNFGQDHVSANQASGPRRADVTTNSYDGVNGSRRQPSPVNHEPVLGSWPASAGGIPSAGGDVHGLPNVGHIDLTCPDSFSSDDDRTVTDVAGQEATSTHQFGFSSPSRVKAAPCEPLPEPWHTDRGGFTSFGASHGGSETIPFRHPSFTSPFQTSWDSRAHPTHPGSSTSRRPNSS